MIDRRILLLASGAVFSVLSATSALFADTTWECRGTLPGIAEAEVLDTGTIAVMADSVASTWSDGTVEQSICAADVCVGFGEDFYWIEEIVRADSGEPMQIDVIAFSVEQGVPSSPPDSYSLRLDSCRAIGNQ